ncbi:HelD family protein [Actinospongicola halichondriae]|uniref:HelD family protein n=1 Tax=Actinospongicola halichondriae TaxID=3236844 RepID=UPI003D580E80
MSGASNELQTERAYLRAAHARVLQLRDRAVLVAEHAGSRAEVADLEPDALFARDVAISHAVHRAGMFDIAPDRLCVGRIDGDLVGEADTTLYIGRVSVTDEAGDPMVVDWRAPVAAAFYRARPGDPMGVVRRRHFRWRDGSLVGLDDEIVDSSAIDGASLHLVGEGALLAALSAPRTGRMDDIVGTIQADQDRIIRRPARGITIVQGGPGTGKTAVALHRAAYLLYELAGRGDQSAVLFIGPNRTFLRYVGDVVPSLGEDQVVLATAADIGPAVDVSIVDEDDVARIKGDPRMAEVLGRAVRGFQQAGREVIEVPCGRYLLKLEPDDVRKIVRRARRRPGTHNERAAEVHAELRDLVLSALRRRVRGELERRGSGEEIGRVGATVDRDAFRALCDRVWPRLRPTELLARLLRSPVRLRHAGRGVLDDDEIALLHRPRSSGWSEGDVALLDELDELLGRKESMAGGASGDRAEDLAGASFQLVEHALSEEMQAALDDRSADCPRCELEMTYGRADDGTLTLTCTNFRCGGTYPAYEIIGDPDAQLLNAIMEELSDRYADVDDSQPRIADRYYAHVVVDEAQDVSAMQWRAILRRSPTRSLTVVGDLDQASQPWSIRDWGVVDTSAGSSDAERIDLTVNYRTPSEVMEYAADRISALGGSVSRSSSVRSSGVAPVERTGSAREIEAILAEARAELGGEGTVVAVVPDALADPGRDDILTATETKGLEFDGVVLFAPDQIAAESARGMQRLYVALTRTTRLLWVIDRA